MVESSSPVPAPVAVTAQPRRRLPGAFFSGVGMFLLGLSLALGVLLAAQVVSRTLVAIREASTIRVKGFAERPVRADRGTWSATIRVRAESLPEGYGILEKQMARLRQFVAERGFPAPEITAYGVSFETDYERDADGNRTSVVAGYRLSQSLGVASARVGELLELSRSATELVKEGIEIDSGRPGFTISVAEIDALKLDLLAEASRNARQRAETLIAGGDVDIGPLRSASQGVFQITPRGSTEISDYGEYDTTSIEKSMKAVVTLDFALVK